MSHLDTLDHHLGARYSAHTRRSFMTYAKRFLNACGEKPAYPREEVLSYLDILIRSGYKAGTIHAQIAGIHALFDACGLTWPLTQRDSRLGLPQEEPDAPTLSATDMAALIRGVRRQPGTARIVTALATVWGLRGDEIARVLAQGCDGKHLQIQTAKGGRRRQHAVPRGLEPILTFRPIQTSTRSLHDIFEREMRAHVRGPRPREGWHSARRSVVTGLLDAGIEEYKIHYWLGWKLKQTITLRYYHPDPLKLDIEMYTRHPYLRVWLR